MAVRGTLFVVSAPSGAGKTSLINAVLAELKSKYAIDRVITYTSKAPRSCEVNGVDYHFVTKEEFELLMQKGFFLENSTDYTAYYGTPAAIKNELASGKSLILIVDRRGARQVLDHVSDAILIWIHTGSVDELHKRLRDRGTETDAQISQRIMRAHIEIEAEKTESLYPHHILNDNFDDAVHRLKTVILSEMCER